MPRLEQGDLEAVARLKERNIPPLAKLARDGYAILTPVPSCTLMFKQEIPLMFPEDADAATVRDAMFEPFEYLMARKRDGLLKTEFPGSLGKVAYHIPCHARAQKIGQRRARRWKRCRGRRCSRLNVARPRGHVGRERGVP
jgi:Fe-S oxidoreductase